MRWVYPLFGIAVVASILALVIGMTVSYRLMPLIVLGPIFWLVMGSSLRCPRCGKHVMDTGRGYSAPWLKVPQNCVGCHRRKDDIWPFQWLVRSEKGHRG
ncbi:MAG: hypothetical protein HY859_06410 [Caulobacterales bacterium]|nr:hypothetical protein [Caulobacterales bacterium]